MTNIKRIGYGAGLLLWWSLAASADWLFYGGDAGGRHFSNAAQITRDNVHRLTPAWIHRSGDMARYGEVMRQTSAQSTPLLLPAEAGESLVYCTPFNEVIALTPDTGAVRWRFDPRINWNGERALRCRGLAYAAVTDSEDCPHRLLMATYDNNLWALNAHSGEPCRVFGDKGRVALVKSGTPAGHVSRSSPPVVMDDVVIVGSSVIDFALSQAPRGVVTGLDVGTGVVRWRFDPLQGLPRSGGANVWAPMSVDTQKGMVFLPVSAPSPDYYGVLRPGDNVHANSVVALDARSGEQRWAFQHVRHDLWDFDTPAQPILFDWKHQGQTTPALAQVTKQGYVFVLNRQTGESLWEITEYPAPPSSIAGERTASTQPRPVAPPALLDGFLMPEDAWGLTPLDRSHCRRQLANLNNLGLFTPLSEAPTLMYPGSLGGANWGGGALWDERGLLLVNVNNLPFVGHLVPTANAESTTAVTHQQPPDARQVMRQPMRGTPYTVEIGRLRSFLGLPCNAPPWGKLVAVDLYHGTIAWEVPLGSVHEMGPFPLPFQVNWGTPNLGGGLVTAGGVFFIGATMDRQFRAFDAATGKQLWRYRLPVDATATPMTYRYHGRQYVVINAGGHAMFGRGFGDYLYAFALEGSNR